MPNEHQLYQLKSAESVKEFIDLAVVFYQTITLESGDVYTGPLDKTGERNGYGLVVFADKSYYLGQWSNDMANGEGRHVALEGTLSEGEWSDNQLNGWARVIQPDGSSYEGEW